MGGKKKKTTIGYKYYMGLHMGLCRGPVDAIWQIRVGDKVAWTGRISTNASIRINQPNLFGGEEQEGGIDGTLDVLMGEPDQPRHEGLAAMLGGLVSAFRGVCTGYFDGLVCAMSPYPKEWSFRVQKTLKGWHGGSPWYPKKCEIPMATRPYQEDFSLQAASAASSKVISGGFTANDILVLTKPAGLTYKAWSRWGNDAAISNPWLNDFWVTDSSGVTTQYWYGELEPVTHDPTLRFPSPAAAEAAFEDESVYLTGSDSYTVQISKHAPIEDDRGGLSLRVELCSFIAMNPAHILYRLYTDPRIGRGLDPALHIDEQAWRAAADTFFAEGMGLCMKWSRSGSIAEFAGSVINHAGAAVYTSRRTGKLVLKPIRSDYELLDLPIFTPDTGLLEIDDDSSSAQSSGVNEVIVKYFDPVEKKEKSVREKNLGAILAAGGGVISETVDYPGIPTEALARRIARRDLQAKSGFIKRFSLTLDRRGTEIMPGHVFRISDPSRGIENMVLRAGRVEFGTVTDGRIRVTALQDVFGLPATVFRAPEENAYVPPDTTPRNPSFQAVVEASYRDLALYMNSSELSGLDSSTGFLHAMAVRPQTGMAESFVLQTRVAPAEFRQVVDMGAWCPGGQLALDIGFTDTSIKLENARDLGNIELGSTAAMDAEIVRVDAVDVPNSVLTIARGCVDTVPAQHSSGTPVICYEHLGGEDPTEYVAGVTAVARIQTRSSTGLQPESSAIAHSLQLNSRAARPYPPGDVRIGSESYPSKVIGDVVLTWAHRDRVTQSDRVIDTLQGSIGPEPGTTYSVRVFNADTDELVHEQHDIAAASAVVPASSCAPRNRLLLTANRSGLDSWQQQIRLFSSGFVIEGVTVGTANLETYAATLRAVGAAEPVEWGVLAGALPIGLHLVPSATSSTCLISGVANDAEGYYPVTIWARDANGSTAQHDFVLGVGTMLVCLPPNGAVGSTAVIDSTARAWASSNMQVVTDTSMPGGKALRLNASQSYATTAHSDALKWWTADFTIEATVKNSSNHNAQEPLLIGAAERASATNYWSFGTAGGGKPTFYYWTGTQRYVASTMPVALNESHHLAMGFSDAQIRIRDNGAEVAKAALAATPVSFNQSLTLGRINNIGHDGNVAGLRILRGIDKYKYGYLAPASISDYPQSPAAIAVSGSLPKGSSGSAYSSTANIRVSGAATDVTVSSGTLPAGWSVTLSGAYVAVTGPAAAAGQHAFTLTVTNAAGVSASLPLVYVSEPVPGMLWQRYDIPHKTAGSPYAVCWSQALALYCAVGDGSGELTGVMTSPDGISWTPRTGAIKRVWRSICWSPELGLFVAIDMTAVGSEHSVMTSPDGINWTSRLSPSTGGVWTKVCWSPEVGLFVAVADQAIYQFQHAIMTSPDGINWTCRDGGGGGRTWGSVVWSPEKSLFVAVATFKPAGADGLLTSPDGINWTSHPMPVGMTGGPLVWAKSLGLFVCMNALGDRCATSPDGVNWTVRSVNTFTGAGSNPKWRDMCWSEEARVMCVVGVNQSPSLITSKDGIVWEAAIEASGGGGGTWGVCWSPLNQQFCAVDIYQAKVSEVLTAS